MAYTQVLLSVFFVFGLTAKQAFAEERFLDVEYYSTMSSSFLKTKAQESLQELLKDFNFNVEQFDIGTDPKVQFTKINVLAHPESYQIVPTRNGIHFQSQNNSVKFEIGEVKVDQIVEREINGIIARIHVFGSCTGVTAGLIGPTSVIEGDVSPLVDGDQIRLQLLNPVVQLGHMQFEFSTLQCTGAPGFDQMLVETVKQQLANPISLDQQIKSEYMNVLQDQLNNWGYDWKKPVMAFRLPMTSLGSVKSNEAAARNIEAWLYPQTMEIDENGNWHNFGVIRIVHPDLKHESKKIKLSTKNFADLNGQTSLIIPDAALTTFAEIYLSPGMWSLSTMSSEIPAFQSLMGSRLKQLFVWRDLWNFKKNAQFLIQGGSKIIPQFQWNDDGSVALNSEFLTDMYYINNGTYARYTQFDTKMQSRLNFSIENGNAVLVPQQTNVEVDYKWDPTYCQDKGNCGSISKSLLAKAASYYLTGRKIEFPLPKLDANLGIHIDPKSLTREKKRQIIILGF